MHEPNKPGGTQGKGYQAKEYSREISLCSISFSSGILKCNYAPIYCKHNASANENPINDFHYCAPSFQRWQALILIAQRLTDRASI